MSSTHSAMCGTSEDTARAAFAVPLELQGRVHQRRVALGELAGHLAVTGRQRLAVEFLQRRLGIVHVDGSARRP